MSAASEPPQDPATDTGTEPSTLPEQTAQHGTGSLLERRYWIEVGGSQLSTAELFADLCAHLPDYAPELLADFEKSKGQPHTLEEGDEFSIRILGPWNGCVRVGEVEENSFTLHTLEGHPEAGKIRFFFEEHPLLDCGFRFEIVSRARSRDGLVSFAYDTLHAGKKAQQATWETFCRRVAEKSGGEMLGGVQVRTLTEAELRDRDGEAKEL